MPVHPEVVRLIWVITKVSHHTHVTHIKHKKEQYYSQKGHQGYQGYQGYQDYLSDESRHIHLSIRLPHLRYFTIKKSGKKEGYHCTSTDYLEGF